MKLRTIKFIALSGLFFCTASLLAGTPDDPDIMPWPLHTYAHVSLYLSGPNLTPIDYFLNAGEFQLSMLETERFPTQSILYDFVHGLTFSCIEGFMALNDTPETDTKDNADSNSGDDSVSSNTGNDIDISVDPTIPGNSRAYDCRLQGKRGIKAFVEIIEEDIYW